MKQQNQQTVFFKEDLKWHFVSSYLDSLIATIPIDDEEFIKLYKKVQDYVETRIFHSDIGDLVDIYVVVERTLPLKE